MKYIVLVLFIFWNSKSFGLEGFNFQTFKTEFLKSKIGMQFSFENDRTYGAINSLSSTTVKPYFQTLDRGSETSISVQINHQRQDLMFAHGLTDKFCFELQLPVYKSIGQRTVVHPKGSAYFLKSLGGSAFKYSKPTFSETYVGNARLQNSYRLYRQTSEFSVYLLNSVILPTAPTSNAYSTMPFIEDRGVLGLGLGVTALANLNSDLQLQISAGDLMEMSGRLKVLDDEGEHRLEYGDRRLGEMELGFSYEPTSGMFLKTHYKISRREGLGYKEGEFWLLASDLEHEKRSLRLAIEISSKALVQDLLSSNSMGAQIAYRSQTEKNPARLGSKNSSITELQFEITY